MLTTILRWRRSCHVLPGAVVSTGSPAVPSEPLAPMKASGRSSVCQTSRCSARHATRQQSTHDGLQRARVAIGIGEAVGPACTHAVHDPARACRSVAIRLFATTSKSASRRKTLRILSATSSSDVASMLRRTHTVAALVVELTVFTGSLRSARRPACPSLRLQQSTPSAQPARTCFS